MHQLIQFRQLTAELNKSELKQLFSTLIEDESFDEQFIITSIFDQMHKNLYNSKKSSWPIQTINNTITNIINEREIPIDDSSEDPSITFESLSSTIINEIGSYLRINEICNFEKTNRRNFISMRYPYPALYSIGFPDPFWLKTYSKNKLFDFAQFKGVKKLGFSGDQYYKLKEKFESHGMIFSKVENLCLCGLNTNQLSFILQKNNFNHTSLKHLSLTEIPICSIEDANAFKQLLTTNKDLKSLQITEFYTDDNNDINVKDALFIDPSIIAQQLSHLNALSIQYGDSHIYEQIVYELNHQIESLHIADSDILNLQSEYPNLKEFCIDAGLNVINDAINKIMKKSKKIEQLNFQFFVFSVNEMKQFPDIIQKLAQLSDLKLLQLTVTSVNESYIGNILSGLNKFLMHHKRDMFKLMVKCNSGTYYDEQILNLIPIMNSWITQFSFVFISHNGGGLKEESINTLKQIVNVECYKIGENQEKYVSSKAIKYVISSNGDIYIPCIYACISHLEYEATCW